MTSVYDFCSLRLRLTRLLAVAAMMGLLIIPASAHAQCPTVDIAGDRWCSTDIPFYFGFGLNGPCQPDTDTECFKMRAAIRAAALEWSLVAASDLDFPLYIYEAGTLPDGQAPPDGILFTLGDLQLGQYVNCVPTLASSQETGICSDESVPPGAHVAMTFTENAIPTTSGMPRITRACVHFGDPSDITWSDDGTGFDRQSIALHEIGHALGLAHAPGGSCLMMEKIGCHEIVSIDGPTLEAMYCIYGTSFGQCSERFATLEYRQPNGSSRFYFSKCGCPGPCAALRTAEEAPGGRALTYELAVNELDGPYTVFATLLESDLVDGSYTHSFGQSYQSAMFRLRVYDGSTLLDESFSTYPTVIEAPTNAVTSPTPQALSLSVAPSPFLAMTALAFQLEETQTVHVGVFAVSGKEVRSLHRGRLSAGRHEMVWDGRLDGGADAPAGVYWIGVRTDREEERRRAVLLK